MNINEILNKGWIVNQNKIEKTFEFKGYLKTISFVNAIAWVANQSNHHPELIVNFKTCKVISTTHDQGNTVTQKDIDLAIAIDLLYTE